MTSKIIVNNIEADSGVSTVTFGSNIQGNLIGNVTGNVNSTGVTTVSSLRIGTGASISSPATNVLALGTNDTERIRINSTGHVGILSTLSIGTNTQVTSSTGLNPVITVGSATTSRLVWGTPGSDNYRLNLSGGGALVFGVDGDSENFGIEGHQVGVQHLKYFGIDNYGRVTTPYQPCFSVYRTTNQSIAHDALTKVEFNTENFDVGSNFDSSTNFRFTAPVAGKYAFMGVIYIYPVYQVEVSIYKNGAQFKRYSGSLGSGGNDNPNGRTYAGVVDLAVNDYVEIYAYMARTGDSAAQSIYGGSLRETSFDGYLIG